VHQPSVLARIGSGLASNGAGTAPEAHPRAQHASLVGRLYARAVTDLEKRRSHTPKRVREQRAYRMVVIGGIAGLVGVIGLGLAVVGVIGAGLPIVAIVIAVISALLFRRIASS
jgi:hypothetical protein